MEGGIQAGQHVAVGRHRLRVAPLACGGRPGAGRTLPRSQNDLCLRLPRLTGAPARDPRRAAGRGELEQRQHSDLLRQGRRPDRAEPRARRGVDAGAAPAAIRAGTYRHPATASRPRGAATWTPTSTSAGPSILLASSPCCNACPAGASGGNRLLTRRVGRTACLCARQSRAKSGCKGADISGLSCCGDGSVGISF
jgi:hypothetical protein